MIRNLVEYRKQAHMEKGSFVYYGTAALKKGHGMCFDLDYVTTATGETATDNFGARGMRVVEKPSRSNNMAFAGVLTQDYPARSTPGPQIIDLYLPGGCALIAGIIPTTVNSTRLTCIVPSSVQATAGYTDTAGLFGLAGLKGRGTAIALKTNTDASGTPWEGDLVGNASYATATGTLTCTNGFTNAAVGDVVWVLAGGVANAAKAGKYYIKTKTSVSAVILASTPGGAAVLDIAANGAIIAYALVPAAEPLTLAYLCDGEESGLTEYGVPVTSGTSVFMAGGWTNLIAGVTLAANDVIPVADGLFPGMRKTFKLHGAIATGAAVLTPASLGLSTDGTIAVTATLQASLGQADFEWTGTKTDIRSVAVAATAT